MKKILTLLLILVTMVTQFSFANSDDVDRPKITPTSWQDQVQILEQAYNTKAEKIDADTYFIPLNTFNMAQSIAQNRGTPVAKAYQLLQARPSITPELSAQATSPWITRTGIIVKRFLLVSSAGTRCELASSINVRLREHTSLPIRAFEEVYATAINMTDSNHFSWNNGTCTATIESDGKIHLHASGVIEGQIGWGIGVSADYKAAGFDVSGSFTLTVRKFHTLSYQFDPMYPGGILY